jgi:hypothetical protein
MPKLKILITLLLISHQLLCQKTETIYFDEKNKESNLYLIVYPDKTPYNGFMLLIPGFGETPAQVMQQTNLPIYAAQQGILTIIPTFKTGVTSFGIDDATQQSFNEILEHVTATHKLTDEKFYIGGFSIGGSCAVKFAELAYKENYRKKPSAVFAIDPPLDFERFYNSCKRNVRLSVDTAPSQEAVYMINRIEKEMGGVPNEVRENYKNTSPYSFSDTTQSAIKNIRQIPIMIFTEPDVDWWLQNRGADFSSMNALDASAMINELQRLGNKKAVLVTTNNKGFRKPDNRRHPHSWSIVDSSYLVKWLLEQK